jgi:hypothetical protein
LPHELNQDRRHHVPRQKKVMNSTAYDTALRQRGSLTVWFTEDAVAAPSGTPSGCTAPAFVLLATIRTPAGCVSRS